MRLLIWGGLVASSIAWVIAGHAVRAGDRPELGFIAVAATAFPLSIGAWYYPHRPLLVRRRLFRGALTGACLAVGLSPNPLLLLWITLAVSLAVGAWEFSRNRPRLREWMDSATSYVFVGLPFIGPIDVSIACLLFLWAGTMVVLPMRETMREALDHYQTQGGRIEDLYATASPEDRRPIGRTTLMIIGLILVLGVI